MNWLPPKYFAPLPAVPSCVVLVCLWAIPGLGWCAEPSARERLSRPVAPAAESASVPAQTKGLSPDPGQKSENMAPLTVPFVEGSESFGIRIPDIDSASGKMRSLLVIGALSRVDDRLLEVRESFLQIYRRDGSPEFSINFPKATLDRYTRKLKSTREVSIWSENFELEGESMELDTVSREAFFEGPIRMVLYQFKSAFPDLTQKEDQDDEPGGVSNPDSQESAPARDAGVKSR